jgi:hypothetical protein
MATREKSKRCAVCLQAIDPNCDWKQGRCPHRPPMIEIQPKDTSKGHFYVSIVKSAIRIVAGVALINGEFIIAGGLLILAEILGIVEELV